MTPERFRKMKKILEMRQTDLTVVMDNVHKPHNLAAIARTCDATGVYHLHAYSPETKLRLTQNAAGGVRRWVKVHRHQNRAEIIEPLLQQNMQIVATALDDNAVDFKQIDYTKPTAIVVGAEMDGISEEMLKIATHKITIPQIGMVQSLNVSVATALVLYEAMEQRQKAGLYDKPSLSQKEIDDVIFENSYPQLKNYCLSKKYPYPELDEDGFIIGDVPRS